jgi:hypothetical protein
MDTLNKEDNDGSNNNKADPHNMYKINTNRAIHAMLIVFWAAVNDITI